MGFITKMGVHMIIPQSRLEPKATAPEPKNLRAELVEPEPIQLVRFKSAQEPCDVWAEALEPKPNRLHPNLKLRLFFE